MGSNGFGGFVLREEYSDALPWPPALSTRPRRRCRSGHRRCACRGRKRQVGRGRRLEAAGLSRSGCAAIWGADGAEGHALHLAGVRPEGAACDTQLESLQMNIGNASLRTFLSIHRLPRAGGRAPATANASRAFFGCCALAAAGMCALAYALGG